MLKKSILISCIVPVYNSAAYLNDTIRSILNQTLEQFELILVDDASQDNSYVICQEWQKRDERIVVLHNIKNSGAAISRNNGLRYAKGKYVIFLDADDCFHLDLFSECYHTAELNQADLVVFDFRQKFINLSVEEDSQKSILDENVHIPDFREILYDEVDISCLKLVMNVPWNKFVKRELLLENSIEFQDIPNSNDLRYAMLVTLCAKKIILLNKILIDYCKFRNGSLSEITATKRSYCVDALSDVYEYITNNCKNRKVNQINYLNHVLNYLFWFIHNMQFSLFVREDVVQRLMNNAILGNAIRENIDNKEISLRNRSFMKCLIQGKYYFNVNQYSYCIESIVNLQKQGKEVALWGCGKLGKLFIDALEEEKIKIACVIDQDKNKQHTYYKTYLIQSYEDVKENIDVIIILNNKFYQEISQQATGKEILFLG